MRTRAQRIRLLLAGCVWAGTAAAEMPDAAVRRFYDALQDRRCEEAVELRSGYTVEQCLAHLPGARVQASLTAGSTQVAVVDLVIDYPQGQAGHAFRGFVTLQAGADGWVIDGTSFQAGGGMETLRDYLASSRYPQLRAMGAGMATQPTADPAATPAMPPPEVPVAQLRTEGAAPVPPKHPPPRAVETLDLTVEPGAPVPEPLALPDPGPSEPPPLVVAPDAPPLPAAGSILDACWTPAELQGRPGERKIKHPLPADQGPPARIAPRSPNPPLGQYCARSLRSVTPTGGEQLIALTFDLCEQADDVTGYDADLVDTLRAHRVKATFYAGGEWMRSHPERAMQLMADPLLEIGNHAWTHGNLRVLKGAQMQEQIHWTQAQYELLRDELLARPCAAPFAAEADRHIPRLPTTFRFPYGTCSEESLRAVAAAGLYPVQWSIVSGDPAKGQTAAQIVKTVLAGLRPGSIVVAHGNGRGWHTAEALKALIPAIRQRSYRFVTVSELTASGTPVMTEQCYEVKPGDNLRYDKLFGKGTE